MIKWGQSLFTLDDSSKNEEKRFELEVFMGKKK